MSVVNEVKKGTFAIGVIHVPPFETSLKKNRWPMEKIIDYCIDSACKMQNAGFSSIMIQNVGDEPTYLTAPPETVANMAAVGRVLKGYVKIPLGICLLDHDGKAPIAVAKAIGADYVRIKTYVGTMSKMTGTLNGIYHEAVKYRRDIHAEDIDIFSDIFDREGYPVGATNLGEMCHFAEYCCMSDGLIITGRSNEQTLSMVEIAKNNSSLPVMIGGGVNEKNIAKLKGIADGFIIGNCLKVDPSDDFSEISEQNCRALIEAMNR